MALHHLKPTKPKKGQKRGKPKSKHVAVPGASRRFRMNPGTLAPVLANLCLGSVWEGGNCNAFSIARFSCVVLPPLLLGSQKSWDMSETMALCQPYTISIPSAQVALPEQWWTGILAPEPAGDRFPRYDTTCCCH